MKSTDSRVRVVCFRSSAWALSSCIPSTSDFVLENTTVLEIKPNRFSRIFLLLLNSHEAPDNDWGLEPVGKYSSVLQVALLMDFSESNYFDVIALPSTLPCIQPSNFNPDDYAIQGLADWSESPCYTELTNYTPSISSSFDSPMSELDQFLIFDYEDSLSVTTFDNLPDQTLMCTDSCAQFLKESSEILRVNSLKFQQKDESVERVMRSVGEDEEKVFYDCSFGDCKKTYSKPAHLRAHLRRHLGLKPYFCNFPNCSWKFSRSDELGKNY